MSFFETPTGYDGSGAWKKIHEAVDKIDCEHCRWTGKSLMNFAHDLVNAKLRKPLHDPVNFLKWRNKICNVAICHKKFCNGIKTHSAH